MTKKRCHTCLRSKDLDQFNSFWRYLGHGRKEPEHNNNCKECEATRGAKEITYKIDKRYCVNTLREDKYLCAFIGNKSYQHICKVYNIKYEEQ